MRILENLKSTIPSIDLLNARLFLDGGEVHLPSPTRNPIEREETQEGDDDERRMPRNSSGHNSGGFFDTSTMGNFYELSSFPVKKTPQAGNMYVFEWSLL